METREGDQESPSYYSILGVSSDCSAQDIRRAYRKLAMQWHPDRWARTPSLLGKAKRKFQLIQEAYSVLSDKRKRTVYDAGLDDLDDEEEEGFSDFLQEMVSLMAHHKKEDKNYSMEELHRMLIEMAQGFESPSLFWGPSILEDSRCSKRTRWELNAMGETSSHVHV